MIKLLSNYDYHYSMLLACKGGDPHLGRSWSKAWITAPANRLGPLPKSYGPHRALCFPLWSNAQCVRSCTLFSQDWWAGITFTHKIITWRDCTWWVMCAIFPSESSVLHFELRRSCKILNWEGRHVRRMASRHVMQAWQARYVRSLFVFVSIE